VIATAQQEFDRGQNVISAVRTLPGLVLWQTKMIVGLVAVTIVSSWLGWISLSLTLAISVCGCGLWCLARKITTASSIEQASEWAYLADYVLFLGLPIAMVARLVS
jgi:hypothetical protein